MPDFDPDYDFEPDGDDYAEVTSCDECGADVRADEAHVIGADVLCDQCAWYREQARKR